MITGTGHSGTAWLALAFSFLGVPTTHEGVFLFRERLPWPDGLAGDVSLAAMPYLDDPDIPNRLIVVRDPLAVFNSFWRSRMFAAECPCHQPGTHLGSPLVRYLTGHGLVSDGDEMGMTIRHITGWIELGSGHASVARLEDLRAGELGYWARRFADIPISRTEELLEGPWLAWDVNAHGPNGDVRPWVMWDQIDDHPDGYLLRKQAEMFGYLRGCRSSCRGGTWIRHAKHPTNMWSNGSAGR